MADVRFIYLRGRLPQKNRDAVLCIGYNLNDDKAEIAVSFCSPSDNFARIEARDKIYDRFSKNKKVQLIVSPIQDCKRYEVIKNAVFLALKTLVTQPHVNNLPREFAGVRVPTWFANNYRTFFV